MTFEWPIMLVFLALIPLMVWFYLRLQKRRKQFLETHGARAFIQPVSRRGAGFRRHIPPVVFFVSLAILLFALARPQTSVSLPRIEGTIILGFDVSGSMAAEDMQPTRIEAAKAAAADFVKRQPSTVQIGVVAFSDNAFAVQLPTYDQDVVLAAINRLSPQRGTSLANGILTSLNAIAVGKGAKKGPKTYSNLTPEPTQTPTPVPQGTYTSAVMILLTDGENNMSPDPMTAAQKAADQGVRIYTVGIGSSAGTDVHVNGITVHTQLFEEPLQDISQLTGGEYFNATNEKELQDVYNRLNPELIIKPQKTEITSIFAGVGVLALLIGGAFSMFWFNRLP